MEPKLTAECDRNKTNTLLHSTFLPKLHLRKQLDRMKSNLYNSVQSTQQRFDVENSQGKLSNEHSRNTLPPELGKIFRKTVLQLVKNKKKTKSIRLRTQRCM